METRLIELETRAAFQEQAVQVLSAEIVKQQQDLATLRGEVQVLRAQLQALSTSLPGGPAHEVPPHY